jgi:serine/threonine-protein kinase
LRDGTEVIFLTMELLRGMTLAEYRSGGGRLTTREVLPLGLQIVAGLRAVHEAGIIYRDLKPGNLMLVRERGGSSVAPPRVVITDFGLARRDGFVEERLTGVGQALGTPLYMAPEQVTSGVEPLTFATDVYALGTVLYELITNQAPFQGSSMTVMKLKCHKERPPSPRMSVPDLDPRWESMIMRCLERLPARRFQNARVVEAALVECAAVPGIVPMGIVPSLMT